MVKDRSVAKKNVNVRLVNSQRDLLIPYFPSQTWLDSKDLGNQVLIFSRRYLEKISGL